MEFFRRAGGRPSRLGVLPGSFNPVTVAHMALARAALRHVDEVVFVLPRLFPHKNYAGATFAERVELLLLACAEDAAFSVAAADGGLFVEMAGECREAYGDGVRLTFLCGRDAAERMVGWDYGRPGAVAEMLRQFDLLVAGRNGSYQAPAEHAGSVRTIEVGCDAVSATEARQRMAREEGWEEFVPAAIRERARRIYR